MANKRFPTDTPYKATPHVNDGLLLSDSEASHQAKMTTINQLITLIEATIDVSLKADKDNVLELNQIDAYTPTEDYHPSTKKYVDDAITVLQAYVDAGMVVHLADFHALSGTHIADIAALQVQITTNTNGLSAHVADQSNPHAVSKSQVGLDQVDNYSAADMPISDLQAAANAIYTANDIVLSAAIDTNTTNLVALSAAVDLLEIGSKVSTESASGSWSPDIANYNHFDITITGHLTASNPVGEQVGQTGMLVLQQDGIGGHTIEFDTDWQFPAGAPVENTTANAFNVFRYTVLSTGNILVEFIADYVEA